MKLSARNSISSGLLLRWSLASLLVFCAPWSWWAAWCTADEKQPDAVQRMTEGMHQAFMELGEMVGGLSADQERKVDALEKKLAARLKANPSEADHPRAFQQEAMGQFREILTPEQKKKYDAQMHESAELAAAVLSNSNLRQIGLAAMLYANAHNDLLPKDLGTFLTQSLAPRTFLAGNTTAKVPEDLEKQDTKAQAAWVNQNSDFAWLAAGRKQADLPANFVLAYVKPAARQKCFLLADGSVQTLEPEAAAKIEAELKAGKNPPPSLQQK